VVVHMIMIGRVLYGLSVQGNLPASLAHVNPVTRTPIVATAVAAGAILGLSLFVPLEGLAEWAARGTLLIFMGINMALIFLKRSGVPVHEGVFRCPVSIAYTGLALSALLLFFDLIS
jgi:APA family basic amino acid/polyamine antiporter